MNKIWNRLTALKPEKVKKTYDRCKLNRSQIEKLASEHGLAIKDYSVFKGMYIMDKEGTSIQFRYGMDICYNNSDLLKVIEYWIEDNIKETV